MVKKHTQKTIDLNAEYAKYYQQKELAAALEKTNDHKLIAFPSVYKGGAKDEWLKLGGNSLLFYKYYIAPRLGKKNVKINQDNETRCKFKDGLAMVHWKKLFLENMDRLKYKYIEEDGLIKVDIKHTFTADEIKSMATREKTERVMANRLIVPEAIEPKVYAKLLKLAEIMPYKAKSIEKTFRGDFGTGLNRAVTEMLMIYAQMVDGLISPANAKVLLKKSIAKMGAILIILNEAKIFDVETEYKLGKILAELKDSVEEIKNV